MSTEQQFDELMSVLDGERWEKYLVHTLKERREEILAHMETTELLTSERKGHRITYFSMNESK